MINELAARECYVTKPVQLGGTSMRTINRRKFLRAGTAATGGIVALGILTRRGDAAEFIWRYANNNAVQHPMNVRLREAVARIREQSGGRVDIQIFPNSQLGGDTDMLSQLRTGAIHLFNLSGLILSTFVPLASISGIGFAFKDYDQVWSAMDGALGAFIRSAIGKSGIYAFASTWDNGYRHVTSSTHPIITPDDLKGFKIRVPVSPLFTSMFKAFGAAPAGINVSEAYSAMQTKIVEGQENPLALIDLYKFYEVQKFVSVTNHLWDGFWTLANGRVWASLPNDLQDVVEGNLDAAARLEREDLRALNTSLQGSLSQKGMIFNSTDPQIFRAALRSAGFYAEWKEKYGSTAWAMLESQVGTLS
jgi:TRAP-type transport system periplasmic protein